MGLGVRLEFGAGRGAFQGTSRAPQSKGADQRSGPERGEQGRLERGQVRQPPAWACHLVLLGGQQGGAQTRSPCARARSRVQRFQTLWTAGSLCPRDFRGRNAGVGYLFQRPFPTQGPHLPLFPLPP